MLVSFEGIDGSGKSTLIQKVAAELRRRGRAVEVTAEPTSTWLGQAVRKGIRDRLDPLALCGLFLADRGLHVAGLLPSLASNKIILTDRYVDSTTAYQGVALDGRVPRPLDVLRVVQEAVFPVPDRVFLLDMAPKDSLKRIQGRAVKEPFEKVAFLERVRKNYKSLARRGGKRWTILDARRPVAALASQVVRELVARPKRG